MSKQYTETDFQHIVNNLIEELRGCEDGTDIISGQLIQLTGCDPEEFDDSELDIKVFSRDTDWFEYIFNNRLWVDTLNADVVIGPIANDTIFDTLGIITSGYLKSEDALKLLMIGPAYTQIAIKTEKAASQLKWIRAERVERPDKETLKKEQKAYEEVFGAALNEIMGYEE